MGTFFSFYFRISPSCHHYFRIRALASSKIRLKCYRKIEPFRRSSTCRSSIRLRITRDLKVRREITLYASILHRTTVASDACTSGNHFHYAFRLFAPKQRSVWNKYRHFFFSSKIYRYSIHTVYDFKPYIA